MSILDYDIMWGTEVVNACERIHYKGNRIYIYNLRKDSRRRIRSTNNI